MKILFASDSLKGTITSRRAGELLCRAANAVFGTVEGEILTIADGGEGTVEAVCSACGGRIVECDARDPLGRRMTAHYGLLDEESAIIEMAAASGLPLLREEEKNPLLTSSWGTGDMIVDALDRGCHKLYLAIGGSATSDGGIGCLSVLGMCFYDQDGGLLAGRGIDLGKIALIDDCYLDERLGDCEITVMCDVNNPLCGKNGAVYTFGPQKGADEAMCEELECGMCHYRDLIVEKYGVNPDDIPGSGAAGGLGTALAVVLHGVLKPGIETVLDLSMFDEKAKWADLVVTGEGCTDWQSAFGKVIQGVGERCLKAGVPCVGVSGSLGKGWESVLDHGIASVMTSIDRVMTREEVVSCAEEKYYWAGVRMFKAIKAGISVNQRMRD